MCRRPLEPTPPPTSCQCIGISHGILSLIVRCKGVHYVLLLRQTWAVRNDFLSPHFPPPPPSYPFAVGTSTTLQETPDCFSPWSTRSFGATTGGIGGGGGGGGGISKGFSFSASQGLLGSSAGTRVFSLPPWRRGESGTDLSRTAKDQGGGGDKRTPDGFGAVYSDDDDDDDDDGDGGGQNRTPQVDQSQRGGRSGSGSYNNQRGNDESGRGGGARAVTSTATNNAETLDTPDSRSAAAAAAAAAEKVPISSRLTEMNKPPSRSGTSSLWPGVERNVSNGGGGGGGRVEDACLTDGSSDDGDGESSYSRQTQNRDGLSLNGSSRPRNEDETLAREETGAFASTDAAAASADAPRRHSSWSAGTRDGSVKGGGQDGGCGLSEHGRRTGRSQAGESQRGDGDPPLVDPENGGVHRLERSRRGVSRRKQGCVVVLSMSPTTRRDG